MNLQLQEIRKRSGLKQKEMAERLGVDVRTYGAWERRENMLSLQQAYDCAVVLNCTIDEIAGFDRSHLRTYSDPRQSALNQCYKLLDEKSRSDLAGIASSFTADPSRLAAKSGQDTEHLVAGEGAA